jgi:hypothetical protein
MRLIRVARITLLAAALVLLMAATAGSTTLIRSGLETLAVRHQLGRVVPLGVE